MGGKQRGKVEEHQEEQQFWRTGRVQSQAELEGLNASGELGDQKGRQIIINAIKKFVEKKSVALDLGALLKEIDKFMDLTPKKAELCGDLGGYFRRDLDHDWRLTLAEAQDRRRTLILYVFKSDHSEKPYEYQRILKHRHRAAGIASNGGYRLPSEGTEQGTDQEAQRRKRRSECQRQRRLSERQRQRDLKVGAKVELRGLATQGANAEYRGKRLVVAETPPELVARERVLVTVDDQPGELSFNRANLRRIA